MNRYAKALIVTLVLVVMMAFQPLSAQINVTFRVNTATVPDTLKETHFVQIRGALNGQDNVQLPDGKVISWGSNSDLVMTNVGGDYWEITFQMNPDDTLRYKIWAGFDSENGVAYNTGWESDLIATNNLGSGNRGFISGNNDTIVPVQFFNGTGATQEQMWRPYESKNDTLAILFRVNVEGVLESGRFNPDTEGPLGVRGDGGVNGGVLDWGTTKLILSNESTARANAFWSGVLYVPKDSVTVGNTQNYKFFIENDDAGGWEDNISNRTFVYTDNLVNNTMDTTLHWVYFNDKAPTGKVARTSTINFRVNVEALEGIGMFDRSVGDSIFVIGPKGWTVPDNFIVLSFTSILQEWTGGESFTMIPGDPIYYKYYVKWDESRVDTSSDNYIPGLDLGAGWEEPGITGGGNRIHYFEDADQQTPAGDFGQEVQFFDGVPGRGVITTPITVTWNVDMRPATDPNVNDNPDNLFVPGEDTVYIQFDGSLFAVTQGMSPSGENARLMLTDDDGDTIYSATLDLQVPTWYQNGFIITYKHNGQFFSNGGGFDKGRRYYRYVHPLEVTEDGQVTWPSEFTFMDVVWKPGSTLDVEDAPNLFNPVGIEDEDPTIVEQFDLLPNYPNPFNPSTTITYRVAKTTDVELKIYNVNGELVRTLVTGKQKAGKYTIQWNGVNDNGAPVASGIYFLRMKAGDFSKVQKMTLLR